MVDFKYKNITFKLIDKDEVNCEYTCDFTVKLSEDFMENNVPDVLFPGNILQIYNTKDSELWNVEILAMSYSDNATYYGLSIQGSCTFRLSSKSVQSEICGFGIV